MLKRKALNKIFLVSIISFCLIVITTFFIDYDKSEKSNKNETNMYVYTLNENNYISLASVYVDQKLSVEEKIEEMLNIMICDNNKNSLLPSYYKPILPVGTKVLEVSLNGDILKIYFSKELLDISADQSEKMIEAITYTVTSFEEVLGVEIYVDNNLLTYVPNTLKSLPTVLTKDYGINKVYELNSNININKVFLCFYDSYGNDFFVTKYINDDREKIEIIVDELSNYVFLEGIVSYFPSKLKLLNYTISDNAIELVFNEDISQFENLYHPLVESLFLNYNKNVVRFIDNEVVKLEIKK